MINFKNYRWHYAIMFVLMYGCCLNLWAQQSYDKLVVAGFYPYTKDYVLKPESIPLQNLTHLIYCFAGPRADGSISTETGSYHNASLVARTHAAGDKFIIMMGGGLQSGGFHDMAASQSTRTIFINTLVDWCKTYGYDGVTIDWEYPGDNNRNEDRQNLTSLITEMRQAFTAAQSQLGGKRLEISMAVHSSLYYAKWVDFATLKNYIDWFGLMSYDYAGDWAYSIHAAHNAPLYCGPAEICDRYLSVDRGVSNLRDSLHIPASQIVMGLAFYGREFYNSELYQTPKEGGGALAYYDIAPLVGNGYTRIWDDQSKVPYLKKNSGSGIISYDDTQSLGEKANYIKQKQLLGAMIWEITQDVDKTTKAEPLLQFVGQNLVGVDYNTDGKPTVLITSPANNFVFTPGGNLTINVNAAVSTGYSIQRVEFYTNGALASTDTSSPYSYTWQNTPAGKHTLKAIAYSSNGKVTESDQIKITDGQLPAVTDMFDDFSYASSSDPALHVINNWSVVDGASGPPSGAIYSKDLITFTPDPANSSNTIMGVATVADNNPSNTKHSRIETDVMPYRNGTFAARVYFDDTPATYGDGNVETFYTINSYATCNNADLYSECDFEYLPWDAWQWERKKTMYVTTWETCEIRTSNNIVTSYAGWHDLIYTAADGQPVKYYIDGVLVATHDQYQPDSDTNISFANWIYQNITGSNTTQRTTTMKVDWVYHAKNTVLARADVLALVASYRQNGVLRKNLAGDQVTSGPVNPAPTVAITSPANNASFVAPASVTINATASDNGAVASVAFYNGTTLLGTDTTSPYSFVWNNVATGSYTVIAKATDNQGATATAQISISVVTNPAPTVTITSPTDGAALLAPANITINATATDNGSVASVAFYNGTTLLNTDNTSPYSYTWSNVAAGSYTIIAKATDNLGATSSAQVNVSVSSNPPPSVSITAPANGTSFTAPASVTITANATDSNGTIASVSFYNGATLLGTDTSSPYSFTWSSVAAGTYSITAKATDNGGAVTTSTAMSITVVANTPPVVNITSPATGASFTTPATVTINANASDANGSITSVSFYNGTTLLGTDTTSPYSYTWSNVAVGNYSLTAKATDNTSLSTTSAVVAISVVNPSPVQLVAVYKTIAQWNTGFQGEVRVYNNSSTNATNWKVSFDCPHEITPIWDGVITSHVGTHYEVMGTSTTQNIAANNSVVFGFLGIIANGQTFTAPSGFATTGSSAGRMVTAEIITNDESNVKVYPNPFKESVNIEFELVKESHVKVEVFNANGVVLTTLIDALLPAGKHATTWNGSAYNAGMYFYRARYNSRLQVGKMILQK